MCLTPCHTPFAPKSGWVDAIAETMPAKRGPSLVLVATLVDAYHAFYGRPGDRPLHLHCQDAGWVPKDVRRMVDSVRPLPTDLGNRLRLYTANRAAHFVVLAGPAGHVVGMY